MKATLTISTCPRCHRALAALRIGASRAVSWLRIEDNQVDLGAVPLTWCPDCSQPLPAAPSVQAAAVDESAVTA